MTSTQAVTLFSSLAILLPWEQFLPNSGALPWVQKLRALRRERSSIGRDPGLALVEVWVGSNPLMSITGFWEGELIRV